jgi:hypothetical protein
MNINPNIYENFEKTGIVDSELLKDFDQNGKWFGNTEAKRHFSPTPSQEIANKLSKLTLKDETIKYKDKDGSIHLRTSFICYAAPNSPEDAKYCKHEMTIPYKTIAGDLKVENIEVLKAPNLKSCGAIEITYCSILELNNLEYISGNFQTSSLKKTSILAPKLSRVDGSLLLDEIHKINLPALQTVGGRIYCWAAHNGFKMNLKDIKSYPQIPHLKVDEHSKLIKGLSVESLKTILKEKKQIQNNNSNEILALINKELIRRKLMKGLSNENSILI